MAFCRTRADVGDVRPLPWHSRLGVRVAAAVAAATATVLLVVAAAGLQAAREHLQAEVVRGAALLSDTLKWSSRQHMLDDRRADAYAMMRTVAGQAGMEHVRVFDKRGRITFSTHAGETGTDVDTRAESCNACHAAGQPLHRLAVEVQPGQYTDLLSSAVWCFESAAGGGGTGS